LTHTYLCNPRLIFFGMGVILTACSPTPPKQVKVIPPPVPAIEQRIETRLALPVPARPAPQVTPTDPVAFVIVEAQLRFERGDEFYRQGFLKRAKDEFDGAIDLLLQSAATYPDNNHLQAELADLVAKVHALELTAVRDGDGFADQVGEHAAIDDLQQVETFPAAIDPKLKAAVEDEIRELSHDLPIEINDRVLGFLNYYQNGRGRSTIAAGLQRVGRYQTMIWDILKEEGVPLDLIYLCQAESAFQPRALSRAKAKGMWQFISSRGKEYGLRQTWWIDERSDPEKSTRAAARHLKDLYQQFGDWYLAMAAYNAGPVRIQRAMEKTGGDNFWTLAEKRALPKETINYIPNILALTIIGKNPEKYGFSVEPERALETERVSVEKATDLRVIAEAIELPVEDLRALNTHVLRWTTPPDDSEFQLILPKGYSEKFTAQINSLPESKRVLFKEHIVRKGETLSAIAKKYGTTTAELSQANNLKMKPKTVLRAGQSVIIPMSGVNPPQTVAASSGKTRPSVVASAKSYIVRKGDTLSKIASLFHVSVQKLRSWNNLASNRLVVGKKLVVASAAAAPPKKVVHKVQAGETLDRIATAYNTSVGAIISWNDKNDLSVIHPGDQITIFMGDGN
jgi:membrane-bound lytic murein transglycosylase D